MKKNPRRSIPAVNALLEALGDVDLPRPLVVETVRRELAAVRRENKPLEFDPILARVRNSLRQLAESRLQPLINGTGVIIHTNFGRAPLGAEAVEAVSQIAASYNNLEYDITRGARGRRGEYVELALAILCGAEAATVVNNCAAALVLIAQHFTRAKPEVIISRGELVQIGGGFRVGEILEASGATLREVGATNKTTPNDYACAIGPQTAMILKVHRSNFFMGGFVASPESLEIAALARKHRIPFVEDLGSGAVVPTERLKLREHEPTPAEAIKTGADLVCFSGDKLFGGPQAGIIAGNARLIAALKHDPIFRALRCDKLILSALQETADAHLRNEHSTLPALAMMAVENKELRRRGEKILGELAGLPFELKLVDSEARIGGGALPRSIIPSAAVEIDAGKQMTPEDLTDRLRQNRPAVIGYVAKNRVRFDLRTIFPSQDAELIAALQQAAIIVKTRSRD